MILVSSLNSWSDDCLDGCFGEGAALTAFKSALLVFFSFLSFLDDFSIVIVALSRGVLSKSSAEDECSYLVTLIVIIDR